MGSCLLTLLSENTSYLVYKVAYYSLQKGHKLRSSSNPVNKRLQCTAEYLLPSSRKPVFHRCGTVKRAGCFLVKQGLSELCRSCSANVQILSTAPDSSRLDSRTIEARIQWHLRESRLRRPRQARIRAPALCSNLFFSFMTRSTQGPPL